MTKKLNARTMPDYFEKRYNSKSMKIFAAIIIFVFLVPYSAAVYKGLGSLFSAVFPGVETWVWMLIIACLTAVYLVAGGYIATAYTDLIQGIIMIVGVVCLVVCVVGHDSVGGLSGLLVVGISTLVITLNSGFTSAAAKSPEMGVAAMAVSFVIVPLVSAFTKNKDRERVEEIFTCYNQD